RPLLVEKVPFLALSLASCLVTFLAQKAEGAVVVEESLGPLHRVANALVANCGYVGKTLWPVDLAVLYPLPNSWPAWQILGAGCIIVGITVLIIYHWRSSPYLVVGWFWFLGLLVPVIGLVQVGSQSMADRYTYLPSIGLFLAVVWLASEFWTNR